MEDYLNFFVYKWKTFLKFLLLEDYLIFSQMEDNLKINLISLEFVSFPEKI
jgi:hypothetical protein